MSDTPPLPPIPPFAVTRPVDPRADPPTELPTDTTAELPVPFDPVPRLGARLIGAAEKELQV